jgi:hypothetical protein
MPPCQPPGPRPDPQPDSAAWLGAAYGTNGLKLTRISSPPPRLNLYERPNKTIRTSAQLGISERHLAASSFGNSLVHVNA